MFIVAPIITIIDDTTATVRFQITGKLTHIQVTNCIKDSHNCLMENVTTPDTITRRSLLAEESHDFTASVMLVSNPEKSDYEFYFIFYDMDDQLDKTTEPVDVHIPDSNSEYKYCQYNNHLINYFMT